MNAPAFPFDACQSMAELLAHRAEQFPDRTAFVFHTEDGEELAWSYRDLDEQARRVATVLQEQAEPGDRAVLIYPAGLEFIAGFFGCLYAGVIPAPATYPKPRRPSSRLEAIVADCHPHFALTTASALDNMQLTEQSAQVRQLVWLATDELSHIETSPSLPVAKNRSDLAFLQYTSGSTSEPRGVMVTHGNLLANLEMIREGFQIQQTAPVGVFWLPAYHDMGLIGGLLTPLYVGGTSHLMAPTAFLRRPLDWLTLISRVGATISGAPNFGYRLCTQKATPEVLAGMDLSQWQLAFCGAEPIHPQVLHDFAAAFAPAGLSAEVFYPCYGLAEATLMVTGGQGPGAIELFPADRTALGAHRLQAVGRGSGDWVPLVGCGGPLGDLEVVIVDPENRQPCAAQQIGEIWLRGDAVAQGYWNAPEATTETYGGMLADGRGPYLRTGDLGCLADGSLYVTGRLKDVIIIRGRNHYPQDLEWTAQQAHEAVDLGAAFSLDVDGEERLVLMHQVHRDHRRGDLTPVVRAIRAAVVEEHEIDPHAIVLLRPGSLPLTSSGKVQRSRCREEFAAETLTELQRWVNPTPLQCDSDGADRAQEETAANELSAEPEFLGRAAEMSAEVLASEVQEWLIQWLSARLGEAPGDLIPTAPMAELGVDSLTAIELIENIEKTLGIRLSPADAWSYPTAAALSKHLANHLTPGTTQQMDRSPVTDMLDVVPSHEPA
jgi:acyl-CoA synthetase (AMP-forming)/AMP-acid ligase II/acyl carrier protein